MYKKKLLIYLVMLFSTLSLLAQPAIKFDNTTIDFGTIKEDGGNPSKKIEFTNTGKQNLLITKVNPGCGCLTADYTKTPIAPGQKGFITVKFNPYGRPGDFNKKMKVSTNEPKFSDPNYPPYTINIKANVEKRLSANIVETQQETEQNVYVVTSCLHWDGEDDDPEFKKMNIPRLWNNGKIQNLGSSGAANSVFVLGNDVYVAGNQNSQTTLWKNGVAQKLIGVTTASSVFVSGNDVYVAGNVHEKGSYAAILWKNGVVKKLTDGKNYAGANSVFVFGNDIYVAGYDGRVAILWKNGISQKLENGTEANSVFVVGNDVYVAGKGEGYCTAILWKNGIAQKLTADSSGDANAYSVFVSGNDVYVAGTNDCDCCDRGNAILWKNGVAQKLAGHGSNARSVYVVGKDVYVAGSMNGNATLWKNGVAKQLVNVRSVTANSVFVKQETPPTTSKKGKLIILTHGLNGHKDSFLATVDSLKKNENYFDLEVVSMRDQYVPKHPQNANKVNELINQGKNVLVRIEFSAGNLSFNEQFSQMDKMLQKFEGHLADVVFIGHSMGGLASIRYGMYYAKKNPNKRVKIITVDTPYQPNNYARVVWQEEEPGWLAGLIPKFLDWLKIQHRGAAHRDLGGFADEIGNYALSDLRNNWNQYKKYYMESETAELYAISVSMYSKSEPHWLEIGDGIVDIPAQQGNFIEGKNYHNIDDWYGVIQQETIFGTGTSISSAVSDIIEIIMSGNYFLVLNFSAGGVNDKKKPGYHNNTPSMSQVIHQIKKIVENK